MAAFRADSAVAKLTPPEVVPVDDPFKDVREKMVAETGQVPAFQASTPGMPVITLTVPSKQSREGWWNFLHNLTIADGLVVLRPDNTAEADEDGYFHLSDFIREVVEITTSRPIPIVCVIKGPLRAGMMIMPAIAGIVLATKNATFGFPDHCKHSMSVHVVEGLKKRCTAQMLDRLFKVGDIIDALEAQRFGIVDFVGDEETVENEVARLIYKNCSPKTTYYMYQPDIIKAMEDEEAKGEDEVTALDDIDVTSLAMKTRKSYLEVK